jgi:hypothetical protein
MNGLLLDVSRSHGKTDMPLAACVGTAWRRAFFTSVHFSRLPEPSASLQHSISRTSCDSDHTRANPVRRTLGLIELACPHPHQRELTMPQPNRRGTCRRGEASLIHLDDARTPPREEVVRDAVGNQESYCATTIKGCGSGADRAVFDSKFGDAASVEKVDASARHESCLLGFRADYMLRWNLSSVYHVVSLFALILVALGAINGLATRL